MNIGQFDEFCNEKFGLQARERKIRDQRKRPVIPASTIAKSVREMTVLGQTSLLAVDQYARTVEARKWHGSKKKDMVVSDSTLPRVLEGYFLTVPRNSYKISILRLCLLRRDQALLRISWN